MRHPAAVCLAALLCITAATDMVVAGDRDTANAASARIEKTFLIPTAEGYGVGECLTGGNSECGQVVANAWCESQGFASAASYGAAARDEYTGALAGAPVKTVEAPIRITCQD